MKRPRRPLAIYGRINADGGHYDTAARQTDMRGIICVKSSSLVAITERIIVTE